MLIETQHSTYGRVMVDEASLETSDHFIKVRLLNEPSTVRDMSTLTVGKVALKEQGGYVRPKGRNDASRVERYMGMGTRMVSLMCRLEDEFEELQSVAWMALVDADLRFNDGYDNGFAAYAKPCMAGAIKNFQNPVRNGTMNIVEWCDEVYTKEAPSNHQPEGYAILLSALDNMTKKQQLVALGLYRDGYSMAQMAKKMGVSKRTIQDHNDAAIKHARRAAGLTE